jgi:hypothetical protein
MNIRSKIFGGKGPGSEIPLVVAAKTPKGAKTDMLHSVEVPREETRRGNTRGGDRHRLSTEQARVTHGGRTHDVELINLSGGGAMVAGDFEPMLWDRVDLHLADEGVIECAVRWLKDGRVGLEFAHETRLECSADEQAVLLREVIARSFPDLEYEARESTATRAAQAPSRAAAPQENDHRRQRRHPLIWCGTLHHDFQSTPVRLRNISATGALVECTAPIQVGSEPLLDLGEAGTIFSTVTWLVGDQVGLRFEQPFDLTQLARSKPEIAPARWERPAYLKSARSADSPWADEWRRMSIGDLRDELEGFMKR